MDILKDRITGLRARIFELDGHKDLFIKAQGLDESVQKIRVQIEKDATELKGLKDDMKDLKKKKAGIVATATVKLSETMSSVLPEGKAIIHIDENGKCFIGWLKAGDTKPRPYFGLSDGEKKAFNPALVHALKGNVNLIEAAEVDDKRLQVLIDKYGKSDVQTIFATCHTPQGINGDGWKVVEL